MNDKPFFVSIDGPKSVGKSTTLDYIKRSWNLDINLTICIEKEINPNRKIVCDLLEKGISHAADDRNVAEALAQGRAQIINSLYTYKSGVVIIDRWYPSDAVFRRYIPFEECVEINARHGVWVPDIVLAMTCLPEISWKRAISRSRGLDSYVIKDFDNHKSSTNIFNETADRFGWKKIDTSNLPPKKVNEDVMKIISEAIGQQEVS